MKLNDADAEVGPKQIQGLFKDFIQFWPNSRTFKALKMKQFFSRIFKDVGTLLYFKEQIKGNDIIPSSKKLIYSVCPQNIIHVFKM